MMSFVEVTIFFALPSVVSDELALIANFVYWCWRIRCFAPGVALISSLRFRKYWVGQIFQKKIQLRGCCQKSLSTDGCNKVNFVVYKLIHVPGF